MGVACSAVDRLKGSQGKANLAARGQKAPRFHLWLFRWSVQKVLRP